MNVGLLALSGIRACDAELLRMGLTLPGFVERSRTIASLPSLGLLTLAGMERDRHAYRYVEVDDPRELDGLPEGLDLAGISSYSAQIGEAYGLADRFRAAGVPVVLGGLHASVRPMEALTHADAVVLGEGEAVWPAVLRDAERGRLQRVYGRRDAPFDLAQAPLPALDLLEPDRYNRLTVQTSRGCPHRCEFCASSVLFGSRYRTKPVDRVVAEIDAVRRRWAEPFIEFADDNALVDRRYWHTLMDALRGVRFRWFAETDLSVAKDERLLDRLRESGCAQLLIGLESPDAEDLRGIDRRSDWKRRHHRFARSAVRRIQERGITVNGCFILGLDRHGPDCFRRVLEFARETELYEVQVTILTPFPGTPLYERLSREGRLTHPLAWERCTLFDLNFVPARMSPEDLVRGFRELVAELYGETLTAWRRARFRGRLRAVAAGRRRGTGTETRPRPRGRGRNA